MNKRREKNELISPDFLKQLDNLQIMSKKIIRGANPGERSSTKRGRSVEFADYRNYIPGDEIRIIDWNVFGRLDKLFVKLFVEEEELTLYILIDQSLSMDFGEPSKLLIAKKIACAISYIALSNFDRVCLGVIGEQMTSLVGPIRGKSQIFKIFDLLNEIQGKGTTSISGSIQNFARRNMRPGLVIILSDFMDEKDFFESLKYIVYQKHSLFLLQVLDGFELNPGIGGDIKLTDMETGEFKEVTITDQLLEIYKNRISDYCNRIKNFCQKAGAGYILAPNYISFENLVLQYLRSGRLLR